jgi:hypothetical protein
VKEARFREAMVIFLKKVRVHEPFKNRKNLANAYNPSNGKAEAGGSQVQGQPELYGKALSQKSKIKKDVHSTDFKNMSMYENVKMKPIIFTINRC